jgi:hypothetical protein
VRRRRRTKTSRSARATIPIGAARVTMKTICDHVGGVSSLSAGVWPTGKARCCRTLASGRGVVTTFRATGATVPRGSIDRPRDDREEVEPRPESSGNSRHSCCSSGGCASRRCAPLSAGPASASTIATTAIPTRWLLPSRLNVRSKIGLGTRVRRRQRGSPESRTTMSSTPILCIRQDARQTLVCNASVC